MRMYVTFLFLSFYMTLYFRYLYSRPAKWEGDKEKEGEKKKFNLYCNKFARLYS